MENKIEEIIKKVKELSKDFDNQDFDIMRQTGKDMFVVGLLKILEYEKHFCKGDVQWQDICHECSQNVQIASEVEDAD